MVLQQLQELGGDHVGDRHLLCRLVGGVAVHDALVTGTALIHAQCDIRRLLIDQDADAEQFPEIKAHLVNTDAGDDLMDELQKLGEKLADNGYLEDLQTIVANQLGEGKKASDLKKGQEQLIEAIIYDIESFIEENNL